MIFRNDRATAESRMNEVLSNGLAEGRALLEHVFTNRPRDCVAVGSAIGFEHGAASSAPAAGPSARAVGAEVLTDMMAGRVPMVATAAAPEPQLASEELRLLVDGERLELHPHALGQLLARAGISRDFYEAHNKLAQEPAYNGMASDVIVHVLAEHFARGPASARRHLLRAVRLGGARAPQVRGFLSDKYRRLDSRPLLEAFAEEASRAGVRPFRGQVGDTRASLMAVYPEVFEPVPGEFVLFGAEWSNSDFGAGRHSLRFFLLRLWCLNGATMSDELAEVHLGARISDDVRFSEQTMRLDTETQVSVLRDVARAVFNRDRIEVTAGAIRAANERRVDWRTLKSRLARTLMKSELERVEALWKDRDSPTAVVYLPPEESDWRASNAVSWLATATENRDRAAELRRFAGDLLKAA